MKHCSKCQCSKPLSEFNSDKSTKDGFGHWCASCVREKNRTNYQKNRAARIAKAKARHQADPEAHKAGCKARYRENREERIAQAIAVQKADPERRKRYAQQTYRNNPGYYAAKSIWRWDAIKQATPPWADRKAIEAVYAEARRMTDVTGIPHEVDHIEPLQHELLCGLHVPWNLQVKTRDANRRKGNRLLEK
ncbi:hypothetical protein ABID82_005107 [Methylobacterium sp. PvP062]|uniref:HNH endonuclease n=1 Tax=Methylobacterium radiotolerans TaxID=31998 RepID=A0ABV2NUD0_9HYPH|nr:MULTISPECIES: hypothetical protein [unclassified Methylobacterium]MBP2498421.1 hypothetical protein [Methylobacterium sp. PvP105]MBP2505600.1 hypothetical protein [Methylobacterium sp. PvP109]